MRITKTILADAVRRLSVMSGRDLALDTSYGQYGIIDHSTGHRLAHQQPAKALYSLITEGLELADRVVPSLWSATTSTGRELHIVATCAAQVRDLITPRLLTGESIAAIMQYCPAVGEVWAAIKPE
jgi:hypothetical protein